MPWVKAQHLPTPIIMKINGKKLAKRILEDIKNRVGESESKPTLVILQVGENPASNSYIRQKKKVAKEIGVKVIHNKLPENISEKEIINRVGKYNKKKDVHGIIVQLPLPSRLNTDSIILSINPQKDVDSFQKNSPYVPPVACAVLEILTAIYLKISARAGNFKKWLASKKISVIGRGKTGGQPIMETFNKLGVKYTLIHTQTKNPEQIMQNADIIISCVGKPNIVTSDKIKDSVILISVGVHRGKDGKLHGDYNQEDICNKTAFYTPTPGGVGPLTVACLMQNIIKSSNNF